MNRGKAKQSSYTLHYGGCFVLGFLAKAIVGVVGVGKEAQVSLRGLRWMSAILLG